MAPGFLPGISSQEGDFRVVQISFVMLVFLLLSDQISEGAKVSEGGKLPQGGAPCSPPLLWEKARLCSLVEVFDNEVLTFRFEIYSFHPKCNVM